MKILVVGLNGAIGTTLVAGVEKYARSDEPVTGSYIYGHDEEFEDERVPVSEIVDAPDLNRIEFGGWDVRQLDTAASARRHDVLSEEDLEFIPSDLQARPGIVGDTTRCEAPEGIDGPTDQLRERIDADIAEMTDGHDEAVMLWLGSTEASTGRESIDGIASRIYAQAAIDAGIPFINGSPQNTLSSDLLGFAQERGVPVAGRDLKTGQTLVKAQLASMLFMRNLGLEGWFSTNILGNGDGKTLQDDAAFESKERSKTGLLGEILDPDQKPELYEEGVENHQVNINYYPPKGDNKEGWDQIDLFGWMDYSMQLKVNFLCRDSILASPLALDLAVLTDAFQKANRSGPLSSLAFYFKDPVGGSEAPEHRLDRQFEDLRESVRALHEETG